MPPPGAASTAPAPSGNVDAVGSVLFTELAVPFEIVSLVLLAAIVGSVVIAQRKKQV
ncbi:MAG TPA: NADH-quinone oxidoreductase subunit J [Vicinamibacteria bacterium]|nr:NADH-quinone oxidoreductase subunit J [Vicinamibacteria bacterium]